MDDDIGWNGFALRNYIPQIGRWTTPDPNDEFSSGYISMGNDSVNNTDPNGGITTSGLFTGINELGRSAIMTFGGAIIGGLIDVWSGEDGLKGLAIGAGIGLGASIIGSFDWNYLLNGSTAINFFVTGTKAYLSTVTKWDAQRLDKMWAVTKSIFSFGHLKIIEASSPADAANQIKKILNNKGKTLGSLIVDSHAHAEVSKSAETGRNYDPLTSTLSIGNGDNDANRLKSSSDIENNFFLKTLSPYVTNSTKIFAGNCWGGADGGILEILKSMSQVDNWKLATFYGEASETISGSLFLRNTFAASGHVDVKFYERGGVYNLMALELAAANILP